MKIAFFKKKNLDILFSHFEKLENTINNLNTKIDFVETSAKKFDTGRKKKIKKKTEKRNYNKSSKKKNELDSKNKKNDSVKKRIVIRIRNKGKSIKENGITENENKVIKILEFN